MDLQREDAGRRERSGSHAGIVKRAGRPLPPLLAIRERCLGCAESAREVRNCTFEDCQIWPWRMGTDPDGAGQGDVRRKRKAMRAYCVWCCGDQPAEPKLCPSVTCPLWPYRASTHRVPETVSKRAPNAPVEEEKAS